jgi:hypothetical protein
MSSTKSVGIFSSENLRTMYSLIGSGSTTSCVGILACAGVITPTNNTIVNITLDKISQLLSRSAFLDSDK